MSRTEPLQSNWQVWAAGGACLSGVTIVLAALKNHLLHHSLTIPDTRSFDLALQYQFYHSLGMIVCGLAGHSLRSRLIHLIGFMFLFGIVAFSGGLYLRVALPTVEIPWIMPVGEISWVIGWFLLAFVSIRAKNHRETS
ncbi:MAG: DUF423 domain-containing protein [Thermogutta sp.]